MSCNVDRVINKLVWSSDQVYNKHIYSQTFMMFLDIISVIHPETCFNVFIQNKCIAFKHVWQMKMFVLGFVFVYSSVNVCDLSTEPVIADADKK